MAEETLPLLKVRLHDGTEEYIDPTKIGRVFRTTSVVDLPGHNQPSPAPGPLVTCILLGGLPVPVDATVDEIVTSAQLAKSCIKLTDSDGNPMWARATSVLRLYASSVVPNCKSIVYFAPNDHPSVQEDVESIRAAIDAIRTKTEANLLANTASLVVAGISPATTKPRRDVKPKRKRSGSGPTGS